MSAVFLKVLNMSLTASWLILAVILTRLLLKKAPKWIPCLLWGLVGVRLICPFSLESALSLIPSSETIPADIALQREPAIRSGIGFVNEAINPVIADSFAPTPIDSANPLQIVIFAAAVVWIAGIVVMLAYALISYLRLKKTVSARVPIGERVFSCDEVKTPFILGVFRPRVFVPSSINEKTLDYVIRHEKAHLKRKDHWWKPLGFLLLTVYWFNPLCWIAYILLCRDIETACDEKVVCDMKKEDVAAYSQALLDCSLPRKRIAACPLAFGESGVKKRVKGVLNYKKPAFWIIMIAVIFCIALAVCLMTDPFDRSFSIRYELGDAANCFTSAPTEAKAGDTVELRTSVLFDGDIHVYADGRELEKSHFDSDYWAYSFVMPEKDVLVTARYYTKDEIWGTDRDDPVALKEKYPEYFGLPAFKGLEVYVWQMTPSSYSCAVMPGTNINKTPEEMMRLKGATIAEMRAILSTYDVDKTMIAVIPWQNPLSSYLGEYWISPENETAAMAEKRRKEYVDKIRHMLFDPAPQEGDDSPRSPIDIKTKTVYANWTEDSRVYACLNAEKLVLSSTRHLPVYKLDTAEDLKRFKETFRDVLALEHGYDEVPSFNEATASYDDAFFADHAVVLAYVTASSGSFRYAIQNVFFGESALCLNVVQTNHPEAYTADMAGWLVIAEVLDADLAHITEYDAILR